MKTGFYFEEQSMKLDALLSSLTESFISDNFCDSLYF